MSDQRHWHSLPMLVNEAKNAGFVCYLAMKTLKTDFLITWLIIGPALDISAFLIDPLADVSSEARFLP